MLGQERTPRAYRRVAGAETRRVEASIVQREALPHRDGTISLTQYRTMRP
jgi:hypothetical protein